MIRFAAALVLIGASAMADPLDDALAAFAADLSSNDPAIMRDVADILANPPTSIEKLGFYGVENKSPEERKFRAVVFLLNNSAKIYGFEDKYIDEMPYLLADLGLIENVDGLSDYGNAIMDAYGSGLTDADLAARYRDGFQDHINRLEDAAARADRALLYIELPLGDTFHVASVSPDVASRWMNVLFLQTEQDRFAVTAPQWHVYYHWLAYALGLNATLPSPVPPPSGPLRSLADIGFAQ